MKSILFVIVIVGILFVAWTSLREDFKVQIDNVKFMSEIETNQFLYRDEDGYVSNLSPLDLYARKVSESDRYLDMISQSGVSFTEEQKSRFGAAAKAADAFLETKTEFSGIIEIPWILAMTEGKIYEEGLPHTRAGIIFVSSNINEEHKALTRTMIHEKLHVYQRMYPEKTVQYLEKMGYKRWKQRLGVPRIRANPDLDPWIYYDSNTNQPMAAYYTSDKPSGITDVTLSNLGFEHPFEKIAYSIANEVTFK